MRHNVQPSEKLAAFYIKAVKDGKLTIPQIPTAYLDALLVALQDEKAEATK